MLPDLKVGVRRKNSSESSEGVSAAVEKHQTRGPVESKGRFMYSVLFADRVIALGL